MALFMPSHGKMSYIRHQLIAITQPSLISTYSL